MSEEEISIEDVVSGQVKMEYIDQLELLRENLSSNSFLNNKSNCLCCDQWHWSYATLGRNFNERRN